MNDIDTSTTEGKIEVMKAAAMGKDIEWCNKKGKTSIDVIWTLASGPTWNWCDYDYRIRPKPPARQSLGPADFPPGTVVSWDDGFTWVGVAAVRANEFELANACAFNYRDLIIPKFADNMRRSLDGGKTWLPCYK